jgi:predicted N-formylglutamate amidohydrolase
VRLPMATQRASLPIVTCEHAGNRLPPSLRALARGLDRALGGYRSFDVGALLLARSLARRLDAPIFASSISRMVVDANRSEHNPAVFGALGRRLDPEARRRALEHWYRPHRERVESVISSRARRGRVVHLAVHTFAPGPLSRRGEVDFGILYDPRRPRERAFAERLRAAVLRRCPELRVGRNRPFLGRNDGLPTALRRRFGGHRYLGIELELSQAIAARPAAEWRALRLRLVEAIASALAAGPGHRASPSRRSGPARRRRRSVRRR